MRSINEQEVLRLNCPGFGHQSHLTGGCARPLPEYRAIIVNPVSVLHLFDKDPDLLRQVHDSASDGLTSYSAKSDKVLESISPDLEARIGEFSQFFENGGLLVYFLCPPFEVQGPHMSLDNYSWLDNLAPDRPSGRNDRHMSAAARGTIKESTADGKASEFAAYFKESVEWSTLIRAENLTEGYSMLATAGPDKCVAGQFAAGKCGKIVFLPAPYSQDYDRRLMECVNLWYAKTPQAPPVAYKPAATPTGSTPPPQDKGIPSSPNTETPQAKTAPPPAGDGHRTHQNETAKAEKSPQPAAAPSPAPNPETAARSAPPPADESHHKEQAKPPAKDLMNKMEKISKAAVPEWCKQYSFPDLDSLHNELTDLKEAIRQTEEKIHKVEGRIQRMDGLKNSLLSAEGNHLLEACLSVFKQMGWSAKIEDASRGEIWLSDQTTVQAIVRVVRTTAQVKRADLAHLAEAVITYWGQHETEPKGLLVASTWANRPPAERTEDDYVQSLAEFAEKKNICLLTTCQLLCIYRDLESHGQSADELKANILGTNGRLPGFALEGKRVEQPVV